MRFFAIARAALLAALTLLPGVAPAAEIPRLFSNLTNERPGFEPGVIRQAEVWFDAAAIERLRYAMLNDPSRAQAMGLNFFGDRTFVVDFARIETNDDLNYSLFGKVRGLPNATATLIVTHSDIAVQVRSGNRLYAWRVYGNQAEAGVREIDISGQPDHPGLEAPVPAYAPGTNAGPVIAGQRTVIDVGIYYSQDALAMSDAVSLETAARMMLAEATQAMGDSGVDVQLRPLFIRSAPYSGSGVLATDLCRLAQYSDSPATATTCLGGPLAGLSRATPNATADIVTLIVENGAGSCGQSYRQDTVGSGFAPYAVNVIARKCALDGTFAHHIGHTLGLRHEDGFADTVNRLRDAMATNDSCYGTPPGTPCDRVNNYSSPNLISTSARTVEAFGASGGLFTFDTPNHQFLETDGTATLLVRRVGSSTLASSVTWEALFPGGPPQSIPGPWSGTLSWTAGETAAKTISIPIVNNTLADGHHEFVVRLGVSAASQGNITQATVTIVDDEPGVFPPNCLDPSAFSTPAGADAGWSVATDWATEGTCSIATPLVEPSTPCPPSGVLTFRTQFSGTFFPGFFLYDARVTGDPVGSCLRFFVDGSETGGIGCSGGTGSSLTPYAPGIPARAAGGFGINQSGTHTLEWRHEVACPVAHDARAWIDKFTVPVVDLGGSAFRWLDLTTTAAENGDQKVLRIERIGHPEQAATFMWTTSDGTATAGTDFGTAGSTTQASGTVSWGPGESGFKFVSVGRGSDGSNVPILQNPASSPARTFTITLSSATGAIDGNPSATVTILDNDDLVAFDHASLLISESGGDFISVIRSGSVPTPSTVTWTTSNGTAIAGVDFGTPGSSAQLTGTLNFSGSTFASDSIFIGPVIPQYGAKQIPIIDDNVPGPSRTFYVTLSDPTNGTALGTNGTIAITIEDPDSATGSGLYFTQPRYVIGEGGPTLSIPVQRTGPAGAPVSVMWSTGVESNGFASAGTDYGTPGSFAERSGVLTWAAGDTTPKNITVGGAGTLVPILQNGTVQASRSFALNLFNPTGGAYVGNRGTTSVLIEDDDSEIIYNAYLLESEVTEGGPSTTLRVLRLAVLPDHLPAATVRFTTQGSVSAVAGQDYGSPTSAAEVTGTISWAAGDATPKYITVGTTPAAGPFVPIINDSLAEPDKTFIVRLFQPTGANLGSPDYGYVTIKSDDRAIGFVQTSLVASEGQGTVAVSVQRLGPGSGVASVRYATQNGTAVAGTHYTSTSGTLTWADGDTFSKTVLVPIINNLVNDGQRAFSFVLSAPVNAALVAPTSTAINIVDDDNKLQFTAATATALEGVSPLVLTVTRTGVPYGPASVTWSTVDGTATAGTDFGAVGVATPLSGTLTWAFNDLASKTITIPILNDTIVEAPKTFTVALSSPAGTGTALGAVPAVTVTLNDNDSGVAFASSAYFVNETGGSLALAVNRIGPVTTFASVTWTTANGSAISGTDFGLASNPAPRTGSLIWVPGDATPKSFTIPILNDALAQGSLSFTVALSAPSAGLVVGTPGTTTVTLIDDETAAPSTLQFSAPKYNVFEGAGPATLTVTRTGDPSIPVSVTFATAPRTALAGADYTTATGTLAWPAGDSGSKTIAVAITNDALAEAPEQFTVALSAPTPGASLGVPATATVLINDDDEVFPAMGLIPAGWVIPAAATTGWHASSDAGAFEGAYQLRTDTVYDGETAAIEVTRPFQAGPVTFRYKVSSELNFDFLRFYVNGIEVAKFSGTAVTGWTLYSYTLPGAGTYTLRWAYEKDGAISSGADAAWIDAVTLPPP